MLRQSIGAIQLIVKIKLSAHQSKIKDLVDLAGLFLLPLQSNQQSQSFIIQHQSVILNNNLFHVQVHTVIWAVMVDGTTGLGITFK